jgi:hypothetical protein
MWETREREDMMIKQDHLIIVGLGHVARLIIISSSSRPRNRRDNDRQL